MIINKLRIPIPMARSIEDANAKIQKQQGLIDYIAIMTDVDIDDEEEIKNEPEE